MAIVHSASVIGDDCVLRQGVTLGNRGSSEPGAAPRLGNGVEVGAGAKIIGAVIIGDGARIGANAVVTRDVPAQAVATGVPARIRPLPAPAPCAIGGTEEGPPPFLPVP